MGDILQGVPYDGPAKNDIGNEEENIAIKFGSPREVVEHHAHGENHAANGEMNFFFLIEGFILFISPCFSLGCPYFFVDFRGGFHFVAFFREQGNEAVRIFGSELHGFRGVGNGCREDAGLPVDEFFQLERAGSAVKGRDFIGFRLVAAFIGSRYDAHRFIHRTAARQYFFQQGIRIYF